MSDMSCQHCQSSLTLKEAITILNGSGYKQTARVRLKDGTVVFVDASQVNPNEVEILD
jgi:copper chaperone CopZ